MIVLVTSNSKGGILQFAVQILKACVSLKLETQLFVPDSADLSHEPLIKSHIARYKKPKLDFAIKKQCLKISRQISAQSPDLVWFADEGIISKFIILGMNIKTKKLMTIHDVKAHISYFRLGQIVHNIIKKLLRFVAFRKAGNVLLLSEYGRQIFSSTIASKACKLYKLPLGAHAPKADLKQPWELVDKKTDKYFLFFGRIDKYKGIDVLVDSYKAANISDSVKLVIAGAGDIPEKLKESINEDNNIIFINRYIKNGEMLYMYKNAVATVLPYQEITQSGVLVMSYYFNTPVIVSDIPGFKEFVIDDYTGYTYKSSADLARILKRFASPDELPDFAKSIGGFYKEKYNWEKNISNLLLELNIGECYD